MIFIIKKILMNNFTSQLTLHTHDTCLIVKKKKDVGTYFKKIEDYCAIFHLRGYE